MEKHVITTKAEEIFSVFFTTVFAGFFYKKTGCKLSINFHGSKGYLDCIEFSCEGKQEEGLNIINFSDVSLKTNQISKKNVNFFYSEENGIRISIGKLSLNEKKLL